jgi:type I restriction enzyme S subunit
VHIEPEHLKGILVPRFHPVQRTEIGRLFVEACAARDKANDYLDEADMLLHKGVGLPSLSSLVQGGRGPLISQIKASKLSMRLDASYHDKLAEAAENVLYRLQGGVLSVNDPTFSREVRAITKFRKRVYVKGVGIPLLTSKQLFQVAPIDMKLLGRRRHMNDMQEIALEENMIAVTCSGTVGKVQIIPKYMSGWAASQDALRIVPRSDVEAGFLFAWLSGEYGQRLLKRHTYGSVVVHIDLPMLKSVPVPNVCPSIRHEVGELVLRANERRNDAWLMEQKAIHQVETMVSKHRK